MKYIGTRSMIRLCMALLFALVLALPGASSAWADTIYNVTIADGIQNGSVTASVNGTSVTQAAEGETVTLLATPTDGYAVKAV
ncbi:MAG: hypothetical protein II885_13860 [Oscillospiraceae bacterium]|nr:hypothetical protein [Oscillospiraceae bacterium]